jgi:hypothetical protein
VPAAFFSPFFVFYKQRAFWASFRASKGFFIARPSRDYE